MTCSTCHCAYSLQFHPAWPVGVFQSLFHPSKICSFPVLATAYWEQLNLFSSVRSEGRTILGLAVKCERTVVWREKYLSCEFVSGVWICAGKELLQCRDSGHRQQSSHVSHHLHPAVGEITSARICARGCSLAVLRAGGFSAASTANSCSICIVT